MLLTRTTVPHSDLMCSALAACWPCQWLMQMKTPLLKSYIKIFSSQDSSSADVFYRHLQVPTVVCLIVNFSVQHCLKQLLSYGEQG